MKKILLTLVVVLVACINANAAKYRIVPNADGITWTATSTAKGFTTTTQGFTITTDQAKATTTLVKPTDMIKAYKNSTIQIDGGTQKITNIIFVCSAKNYCFDMTVDAGKATADADNKKITWAGEASSITFTNSGGQNRITEIRIYTDGTSTAEANIENTAETAYTVAKAMELIEDGEGLSATVFVKGIISKVDSFSDTYGSITYWISDDGTTTSQQFECYGGLNVGGEKFTAKEDLSVGSEVTVKGKMKKYTPKDGDPVYEFDANNEIVSISTAINAVETSAAVNAPAYNIAGQRVNADAKGLVIKGGKKYINK